MAFETFAVHAACIRGVEAIPVTVEVSLAGAFRAFRCSVFRVWR